jgi:hypothetical protein
MIRENYLLKSSKNRTIFHFESVGSKGIIEKIVCFDETDYENVWNLGFGDGTEENWNDEVISNNGDIFKILNSVAAAILEFSEEYPTRKILINPIDSKRKNLYNLIFKRKRAEIAVFFEIKVSNGGKLVDFNPNLNYNLFILTRK